MKTLQNNFTTPEQSKRLLELGVPADSADCAMFPYDETFKQYELRVVPFNKIFSTYEIYNEDGTIYPGKTPCWSAGRLMEIVDICCKWNFYEDWLKYRISDETIGIPIEHIVSTLEYLSSDNSIDFSKLEE